MDNLNTHGIASLYEAFPPDEAFALAQRLDIHHTPKHGSWLKVADIELSALSRQSLSHEATVFAYSTAIASTSRTPSSDNASSMPQAFHLKLS